MHYLQLQTFKEQVTRAASKMHRYPQETQEHFRNRPSADLAHPSSEARFVLQNIWCRASAISIFMRDVLQNLHAELVKTKLSCNLLQKLQLQLLQAKLSCKNVQYFFVLLDFFAVRRLCREVFFVVRLLCCEMMWVFFCCETPYWPHCETSLLWNSVPRNTTRLLNFFWKLKIIVAKVTGLILPTPERVVPIYTKAATCTTLSLHSWLCASWPH